MPTLGKVIIEKAKSPWQTFALPAGSGPLGIATDGTNIWTANFNGTTVTKLNFSGAIQFTATILSGAATARPYDLAWDGGKMWVTNNADDGTDGFGIGLVNGAGTVSRTSPVRFPTGIAYDNVGKMYICEDDPPFTVAKFDTTSNTGSGVYSVGTGNRGIAYDGTEMWAVGTADNSINKLPPGSPPGTGFSGAGFTSSPYSLASDGAGNMWICNGGSTDVSRFNTTTHVFTNFSGVGGNAQDIAFDGTRMWTANTSTNSVSRITLAGSITTIPGTGSQPTGIVYDGVDSIWVCNFGSDSVSKLKVF